MNIPTETLYDNSAFAEWLKTMPENVKSDYAGYKADLGGTRIEILFYIEDKEASE